tara:strand:+ start:255 stop:668 length:414 start_codon:yes stop_codon:yes gene_type:complete
MTLFDWLKEINFKKSDPKQFTTDDWKSFTPFMINRYLSLHPELIVLVNEVQMLNTTNKKTLYNAYRHLLPKQSRFAKYIKGKTTKVNTELVKIISRYFEISNSESKQYIKLLTREELSGIVGLYGYTNKQIKKIVDG